jgi:uncharacterized peroxidase-related enzyme
MSFIETVPEDAAAGQAAQAYAEQLTVRGYVPNYLRLFALRPGVYAAWRQLVGSITSEMDLRRYELATLAAARALRSAYCATEHGMVLRNNFYDADTLRHIASDHTTAGLAAADVAVMDFADQVARDASSVGPQEIQRLRGAGLSDAEIFDVALAAAARCFFSTVLQAMGAEPDAVTLLGLEAPLRAALMSTSADPSTGTSASLTC